jgi:hypothetical protein
VSSSLEKKRYFERGGTVTVHLFLKTPGKPGMWNGTQYKDGFNVFCSPHGNGGEPRLRSRHLAPEEALDLAESLDTMIGIDGSGRSCMAWVNDSFDLMPDALDGAIRDAESRVHELRRIRSALTGRY